VDQATPDDDRQLRVTAARALALQLDAAADLVAHLDFVGWERHFRRDAELLRLRADREAQGE
jgi:hypothetical protein